MATAKNEEKVNNEVVVLTFDSLNESEFYDACKQAGVSNKRLKEAVGSTFLPESGTFVSYKVEGGQYPTVRLITDSGDSISCGTLQLMGFDSPLTDDETTIVESSGKTFYRRPKTAKAEHVNPSLTGNYFNVVQKLLGKEFTAVEKTKFVSDFVPKKTDKIEFKGRKSYKIEIL